MLAEFFIWWTQQMEDLWSGLFGSRRYATAQVARMGPSGLALFARRRGTEISLPLAAGRRRGGVILSLGPDALMEQTASLPLAAERDLATALRFEMDRFTPFRADDMVWSWRVTRRDRANATLGLNLLLVPRAVIQPALTALAAAGLHAAAVEVPATGGPAYLSLDGPDAATGRRRPAAAAWVCAGLAVLACLIPVWRQERAITAAQSRIASLRPQVTLAEGLRRRLEANASGAGLFAAEASRAGSALRALAAVTAALPDDTHLTSFGMHDRKMSLAGSSAAAGRLISELAQDPDLRDPAFDAPITRAGDHAELFSIQVSLAP